MALDTVVWAGNCRGELTYIEPSIEKLVGWTADDLLAMPSLAAISPDHIANTERFRHELAQTHSNIQTYNYRTTFLCKDDSLITVCNCVVILKQNDLVVGVLQSVCPIQRDFNEIWPTLKEPGRRILLDLATILAR